MAPRTRRSTQAGVVLALLALLCGSYVADAASRTLMQGNFYQSQVSTDFAFGVNQFDRSGFQQTIGSYFQARVGDVARSKKMAG
jgi:hypothetical protein